MFMQGVYILRLCNPESYYFCIFNKFQILAMLIGGLALLANTFLLVALGFVRSRGKTSHHSLITSLCFGNILFCISVILYIVNKVIRSMKTALNWKRKEWKLLHSYFVLLQHPEGTSKNLDKPIILKTVLTWAYMRFFFSIFKVQRKLQ